MGGWSDPASGLLGVVFVVALLLAHAWRRVRSSRPAHGLSALAAELGLSYHAPSQERGQGQLRGSCRGRSVLIDADERKVIMARFAGAPRIDLRSYEIAMPVPFNMVQLSAADDAFNRYWKTRRASVDLAEAVEERATAGLLAAFRGKFARNVASVIVTAEGVTCSFDRGKPPSIPPEAVRELLRGCLELAELVEPTTGAPDARAVPEPVAIAAEVDTTRAAPARSL